MLGSGETQNFMVASLNEQSKHSGGTWFSISESSWFVTVHNEGERPRRVPRWRSGQVHTSTLVPASASHALCVRKIVI